MTMHKTWKVMATLLVAFTASACARIERMAIPSSKLADITWALDEPGSPVVIDHSAWTEFLEKYLIAGDDGINRVAYSAVGVAERASLNEYIARLAAVQVSMISRREQLPYWVNLYNALTVRLVLVNYPVKSIRNIQGGLFNVGPWGDDIITVQGAELSLEDIEHRIIRPVWRDHRVHYVLNCAALGCPNLAAVAYTGADMEQQMEAAARAYINHPRGARFDGGKLTVSRIYVWFKGDFGGSEETIIDHLRKYADAPLRAQLDETRNISRYKYDWALNAVTPAP